MKARFRSITWKAATRRSSPRSCSIGCKKKWPAEAETKAKTLGPVLTEAQMEAYSSVGGTPHLDGQYTVFGEVVEGQDIVDRIQQVETLSGDRPKADVVVVQATVLEG